MLKGCCCVVIVVGRHSRQDIERALQHMRRQRQLKRRPDARIAVVTCLGCLRSFDCLEWMMMIWDTQETKKHISI